MDKAPLTATCPTTLASLSTIIEHLIAENMALREQLDDTLKTVLTSDHPQVKSMPRTVGRPAANKA